MLDEFDDDDVEVEYEYLPPGGGSRMLEGAVRPLAARLIARLYRAAGASVRTRMLACLVRPLGSLGLAAVASGAFAQLVYRGGTRGAGAPIEEMAAYSSEQIFELARFVEQVSPDAIAQVAGLLADNPIGASGFSAAVAMLLVRAVRGLRAKRSASKAATHGRSQSIELDAALRGSSDDQRWTL